MASLQCDICGGKLIMKSGNVCECCDCGMLYDKEWIKEKVMAMHSSVQKKSDDNPKTLLKRKSRSSRIAISAKYSTVLGLSSNGTVETAGNNDGNVLNASAWTDIVAIACGYSHAAGIKSDGTVVTVGDNEAGKCNVTSWTDIVDIACGFGHTVGLKSDGSVVAVGDNEDGNCEVSGWTDIVAIACNTHTVGLKSDGTVMAVGNNYYGQCNVSSWTDIVAIKCGYGHTMGIKSDGSVVMAGDNKDGQCDVEDWTDIVDVACSLYHTVALKSDGTVEAFGDNDFGQCEVDDWSDIVAVECGNAFTVGLMSDGTVVAVGENNSGQCDVEEWELLHEDPEESDLPNRNLINPSTEAGMRQLRAVLYIRGMVENYCSQFNSCHRGKREWDAAKESYSPGSVKYMHYFLAKYSIERAKYITYEKYWRKYLKGEVSRTSVGDLIEQANQSMEVKAVMGDLNEGYFEDVAEEYDFPYSTFVASSAFAHIFLGALIKNELVLTYINELNSCDLFKELSVDEALSNMKFVTSDDRDGNIFVEAKKNEE